MTGWGEGKGGGQFWQFSVLGSEFCSAGFRHMPQFGFFKENLCAGLHCARCSYILDT
jgi:hypothetical protein